MNDIDSRSDHTLNVEKTIGYDKRLDIDLGREPLTLSQALHLHEGKQYDTNLNPLVATASTLISLSTEIREQRCEPDLAATYDLLCEEITAFETKANAVGYDANAILAARYILCAFIDETILTTTWGQHSRWQSQNLLNTFQRENWGGDPFFAIVERSLTDPKRHLDLLELSYLCLSLGYEGKYRLKPSGHQDLLQLLDRLYQRICDEHGEFSKRLISINPPMKKPKRPWLRLPSLWTMAGLLALLLVGMALPYHVRITKMIAPLKRTLHSLSPASFSAEVKHD